ncbi:dihydrodipicolinate synthase family protein [Granulosicoccus sp. 3-233]|uniref:dihydrodipicolinate synthase family protein n=1 Tax=Granulosicoccus sp. 3-233 TaxID=3417969 RepID=UPI003D32DCE4
MAMRNLDGIHYMIPTPFTETEDLDLEPIAGMVDLSVKDGCKGVVCLGVTGEANRLDDKERNLVIEETVRAAGGRIEVTVGTSGTGTRQTVERCKLAESLGATAVMVAAVPMPKSNLKRLYEYYVAVAGAVNIQVVVQDYPAVTGVQMPPDFIAKLVDDFENINYLKLEDTPCPQKVTEIRNLTGDALGIFGGLGGVYLYEELCRGAVGAMSGFAYQNIFVQMYDLIQAGDKKGAGEVFYKYLPAIRLQFTQGLLISLRKEIMKRRGLMTCTRMRHPGVEADQTTIDELFALLDELGLE